jgi:hypothetical protein
MDNATRGFLEWLLDKGLEIKDIAKEVLWIENEIPLQSPRDLVLGYVIGLFDGATRLTTLKQTKTRKLEEEDN